MNKTKKKKEWVRTFEISEPVKHDKGYMIYEVTSWLFPMGFPEASTKLVTNKRFSDFQKLHKALSQIHKNLHLTGTMPFYPKSSFFNRYDPNILAARRVHCVELLEFSAKHPQLYNSQVFLNFFATVSSPTSLTSDEEIGQLMDQGQIMEAAMASTKLARDTTPTLEPEKPIEVDKIEDAEDSDENEEMPNYLNEAANVIKKAIECESEERFDESIACYRKAIGTLLTSLPKDKCLQRQASVKRRISQYITKAESLTKIVDEQRHPGSNIVEFPHLDLFCDVKDLKRYQVESILSGKVILATDSKENNIKVVIKTLPKASFSTKTTKQKISMLPINAKYMAKLKRYYETDEELILVIEYVAPGPLFNIVSPYLIERASRLFSNAAAIQACGGTSVITPDPEFIRSRSAASMIPKVEVPMEATEETIEDADDSIDEELEIICSVTTKNETATFNENLDDEEEEEDIETELICLSKGGIEKIECYDHDKRERERFEMLDDHTNEVIKKIHEHEEDITEENDSMPKIDPDPNLLHVMEKFETCKPMTSFFIPNRLMTPALSSAPLSAMSTAPVSPAASPQHLGSNKLHEIIPTFGGFELKTCKILPMSLLKSWTVQLVKAVIDLHSRGICVQDLNPCNILLNENGELTLTYHCQWISVENPPNPRALNQLYVAPEVVTQINPCPEADWWSVGVILFELLTGWSFCSLFPSGLQSHTPLTWNNDPDLREGEDEFRDLITKLLQPLPEMRLTKAKEIKSHRFFVGINWKT